MPTRRIHSPDHDPPSHMVYSPGVYEHTCSGAPDLRTELSAAADALDDAWAHMPGRAVTMRSRVDAARKRARRALGEPGEPSPDQTDDPLRHALEAATQALVSGTSTRSALELVTVALERLWRHSADLAPAAARAREALRGDHG